MHLRFETVLRQVARARRPSSAAGPASSGRRGSCCLQKRIHAREVTGERIAFGICLILALASAGFAAHAIGSGPSALPNPLPSLANGVPTNRALAEARRQSAGDPDTTGSLGRAPEAAPGMGAGPGAKPQDTGYVLRWALQGTALVEGPNGLREVRPGSVLPGAGRITSIERSDAGWIVVTSETVIGPASL